MSNQPFSPVNPIHPSDYVKNDVPAETDDLKLGHGVPAGQDIENAGSDPDAEKRRTGGSSNDPHGGRA